MKRQKLKVFQTEASRPSQFLSRAGGHTQRQKDEKKEGYNTSNYNLKLWVRQFWQEFLLSSKTDLLFLILIFRESLAPQFVSGWDPG